VFLVFSFPFFLYSFLLCKKRNVAFYLSIFIGVSFVLAFISPLSQAVESLGDFLNLMFIASLLLSMVHAFRPYHGRFVNFPSKEPDFFWPFVCFLIFSLLGVLVLNVFIVYKSFTYIIIQGSDITEFKNQGLAYELIRQWVNPKLVTVANLFSPLGYVAIGLHFYFLLKNKLFFSFVFFILALNLPLSSLHGLSRAGLVHFILIYTFMFLYIQSSLNVPLRSFFRKLGLTFWLLFLVAFLFITYSRFGDGSYHSRYSGLGSFWEHNTVILSLLDYGSQWITNALVVLELYTPDKIWFGKSSFKVFEIGAGILGVDYQNYADIRQLTLGENASKFLGLVAVLIYDFGYIFTVLIFFLFYFLVRYFAPEMNVINKRSLIYFPILIAVPVMFFTNNYLASSSLSVGIVYLVCSAFILHLNIRRRA